MCCLQFRVLLETMLKWILDNRRPLMRAKAAHCFNKQGLWGTRSNVCTIPAVLFKYIVHLFTLIWLLREHFYIARSTSVCTMFPICNVVMVGGECAKFTQFKIKNVIKLFTLCMRSEFMNTHTGESKPSATIFGSVLRISAKKVWACPFVRTPLCMFSESAVR